jgi:hypothetical protein
VLEVTLSNGDELLVRVTDLLVIDTLFAVGSDHNSLGSPLQSPLVTFGTFLGALASCLEWCPSTIAGCRHPVVLDENSPDCLLIGGVPGGDVEQLCCGLWLFTTELMH